MANTPFLSPDAVLQHPIFAAVSRWTAPVPAVMYFVVPPGKRVEEMYEAGVLLGFMFQVCQIQEYGFNVHWVMDQELFDDRKVVKEDNVFVFDNLDSQGFKYLFTKDVSRIRGIIHPAVLRDALKSEVMLNFTLENHPTCSLGMKNLVVYICDKFDEKIMKQMGRLITLMNGRISPTVTHEVTHAIVKKFYPKVSFLASGKKIQVMTADWIKKMWDISLSSFEPVHATFYTLRYVHNLFETVKASAASSQLGGLKQEFISAMVERNGGKFSSDIVVGETNMLVVINPNGPEYELAKARGIPCLNPRWLKESEYAGRLLPMAHYMVNSTKNVEARSIPPKNTETPRHPPPTAQLPVASMDAAVANDLGPSVTNSNGYQGNSGSQKGADNQPKKPVATSAEPAIQPNHQSINMGCAPVEETSHSKSGNAHADDKANNVGGAKIMLNGTEDKKVLQNWNLKCSDFSRKRHLYKVHGPGRNEKFDCPKCGRDFTTPFSVKRHRRNSCTSEEHRQ